MEFVISYCRDLEFKGNMRKTMIVELFEKMEPTSFLNAFQ